LRKNHQNLQQVPDDLTDEDIQISASEVVEQASYDFETELLPGEPTQNALSLSLSLSHGKTIFLLNIQQL